MTLSIVPDAIREAELLHSQDKGACLDLPLLTCCGLNYMVLQILWTMPLSCARHVGMVDMLRTSLIGFMERMGRGHMVCVPWRTVTAVVLRKCDVFNRDTLFD
jgi:hypothetical protein